MDDWKAALARLVAYYQAHGDLAEPFYLFDPQPPSDTALPESIPQSHALQAFYAACGGGEFGPMIRFIPVGRIERETTRWIDLLKDYDDRGDVLVAGRHIVFANDADGTPWILDGSTGEVASFYWKGGDWEEPRFESFDAFMTYIFDPSRHEDGWREVLEKLQEPRGRPTRG